MIMKTIHSLFIICALTICIFSVIGCTEDSYVAEQTETYSNTGVEVTKNGYLKFDSSKSLEEFVENINKNGGNVANNICSRAGEKSFESLADLSNKLEKMKSRSDDLDEEEEEENEEELEEMSVDEFNLMKCERLIFDNVLYHLVDTTLRICVEGRLYKITPMGTFSIDGENEDDLDAAIEDFNTEREESVPPGGSIEIGDGAYFTNSFGSSNSNNDGQPLPQNPNTISSATNSFHTDYNTNDYIWENHSVFQKFLDWLRGKDVSREKKFDKNHRVSVNVFDVNYQFYASAGVKVKMQQRKKFLGIPYWKCVEATKIAIGFNHLEGEMKYNNPRSFSSILPTTSNNWRTFTGTLNGIQSNYIYGMYSNLPFIKDWTNDIVAIMPELNIGNQNYIDGVVNYLYDSPKNVLCGLLNSLTNKVVYYPIEKRITPKDPKVAYMVWGNTSTTFNKEHPFIVGVTEYSNIDSKSVIFDRSFGFSMTNMSISGFLPTEFDIKSLDLFGAAYYDNEWRGVRFTKE